MKVYPYESNVGMLWLEARGGFLCRIYLNGESLPEDAEIWDGSADAGSRPKVIRRAMSQLDEYFLGMRRSFDLPLEMEGTEFQKQVWEAAKEIPYGTTVSYGELSERITGNKGAARAVGSALGKNPLPIVIPCHRVLGSDGSLTGFGGGVDMKAQMLTMEWLYQKI